ncbi:MAG: DUF7698 family protein [Oscillospiraceae bacterium]|jgi:hypothetical protein
MKNEYLESLLEMVNEQKERVPTGTLKILRAYYDRTRNGNFELDIEDGFFESELNDALQTLEAAGINNFRLYDNSSGLMATIYYLLRAGFQVETVEKVSRWGDKRYGLRFYK